MSRAPCSARPRLGIVVSGSMARGFCSQRIMLSGELLRKPPTASCAAPCPPENSLSLRRRAARSSSDNESLAGVTYSLCAGRLSAPLAARSLKLKTYARQIIRGRAENIKRRGFARQQNPTRGARHVWKPLSS